MAEFEPRQLHLHTLESLLADLISGREVVLSTGERFRICEDTTRAALEWYRKQGPDTWTASVSQKSGIDLVSATFKRPPELSIIGAPASSENHRRLTLKKLEAHRFAGLHKFGAVDAAPKNYVKEFSAPVTLFEGMNGSGKTSLANAIIWALTGEILRPQREPERGDIDFECWITAGEDEEKTAHRLSPVTPLPTIDEYRPNEAWIPTDTWVELTFVDENGTVLPSIRRTQTRSAKGKLKETPPDLSLLGVDPIAVRIGTIMPGLLPLIKVGTESELGRAVAQLTGLSALNDLADHARRAKKKVDADYTKDRTEERDRIDQAYQTARMDLEAILQDHPAIAPNISVPFPSNDGTIEQTLADITNHLGHAKARAFDSAQAILGENFNPTVSKLVAELEQKISIAIDRTKRPQDLPATELLQGLRSLSTEQLEAAEKEIDKILVEAKTLSELAKDPSGAARARLYARVAAWVADHPEMSHGDDFCVVCGGPLKNAHDPISGKLVSDHLHEAKIDAALVSQTLARWAENTLGSLARNLPEPLRRALHIDLPAHPCDLLRTALIDQLFELDPFRGVLGGLKAATASRFDRAVVDRSELAAPQQIAMSPQCKKLSEVLVRLDQAIRFARWRHENEPLVRKIFHEVLGRLPKEGEIPSKDSLIGVLLELDNIVRTAKPISDALTQCNRLTTHLESRRAVEKRLDELKIAGAALGNLLDLGRFADEQVEQLRGVLRKDAIKWRSAIYSAAYDTGHELIDARMGRKGELALIVGTGDISAPAEQVANASALRASLVGFFLAFWDYVIKERGGIATLVFDDPQELLDDENRERLAAAIKKLSDIGAQPVITSYDRRFSALLARNAPSVDHLKVHPATRLQPYVETSPTVPTIRERQTVFEADRNAEEPARLFVDGCRVFLEAELGNLFDDPAHSTWIIENPDPCLSTFVQRLRPTVKGARDGLFSADVFHRFVDHRALADKSPVLTLMNKAHHGRREEIRPGDVAPCASDLIELVQLAEQMAEESYRWRRCDRKRTGATIMPLALPAMPRIAHRIQICPDLAAFTQTSPAGETQETIEWLDPELLEQKSVFYLRRPNFGFAAPSGALAIVESIPGPSADRRLVIARHGTMIYARRLLKGTVDAPIALTADIPDPRNRPPKTVFLPADEVALHQVVGIIFDHSIRVDHGAEEAVEVDGHDILRRLEVAFRVRDQSAVPLALERQIVLGGKSIDLTSLDQHKDKLVALNISGSSGLFKRVGAALPGDLVHLRQFESIGGLGASEVISVGREHPGLKQVVQARLIFGVLYHG